MPERNTNPEPFGSAGLTRRDFLKLISVGAGAAALTSCDFDFKRENYDKEVSKKIVEFLRSQFKFNNFYFGNGFIPNRNDLQTTPIMYGYDKAIDTIETINTALSKYPPELFNNLSTSVKWSYLVGEDIKYYNSKLNLWEDYAGTISNTFDGEQIVCAERHDLKRITHHEFFHLITNNLVDKLQFISEFSLINVRYNLPNYKENIDFLSASQCIDTPPPPGYSRCYGEWNAIEDAATIAESIMMQETLFRERVAGDAALDEKAKLVKLVYEKVSSGTMNISFFENLPNLPENPWQWPEIPQEIYL